MEILHIPFHFDREDFNKRIHIELYEGMEVELESVLKKALPLLKPKAIYLESSIEKKADKSIELMDQNFSDVNLLAKLDGIQKVFPYITTCGNELESLSSGDMLEEFWFDALKQMSMDQAFDYFREHIRKKYKMEKLYSINPGSNSCGDGWDLRDQKKLFSLFPNVENDLGVTLTKSMLMFPNKTISGFLFESEIEFITCRECDNIDCSNRKMIHEGAICS